MSDDRRRGWIDRRGFNAGLAGAAGLALAGATSVRSAAAPAMLYSSIGDRLSFHRIDVASGTLTRTGEIRLPSSIQYAWLHPTRPYVYASTSDAEPGKSDSGHLHRLCALRINHDGSLEPHGEPAQLRHRPIHNSVDGSGRYALTCYSSPADITVHQIAPDGGLAGEIAEDPALDHGIFPHQVRTTPSDRSVVLVTRGNNAGKNRPEDPGALKLFRFEEGRLSPLETVTVGGRGGYGYGPRHLDFHPRRPWAYVSLERENQLHMHRLEGIGIAPQPSFIRKTTEQNAPGIQQLAGAIFVHPQGHTVYVSNRASGTVEIDGRQVFAGGQNSIAVFSIHPESGEPTLVQQADPRGFHVRSFTIDPTGQLLIAATMVDMDVRASGSVEHVSAGLSLFRIARDGRLTFIRKYGVTLNGQQQLWVAAAPLAGRRA